MQANLPSIMSCFLLFFLGGGICSVKPPILKNVKTIPTEFFILSINNCRLGSKDKKRWLETDHITPTPPLDKSFLRGGGQNEYICDACYL